MAAGAAATVATAAKHVPLTPGWLYQFILSTNCGPFDAQINGEYVGRRFVTYLNDLSVGGTFLTGLQASYTIEQPFSITMVREMKVSATSQI